MSKENEIQDFEVIETLMFQRPPEWGRRVIKRGDEVLLQSTEDKGLTWTDVPIPDAKLVLPKGVTRSVSANPYSGVLVEASGAVKQQTRAESKELSPEVAESIESGQLLTQTTDQDGIETITFLAVFATSGLPSGTVWRDGNNYLRIVP